ncbi:MAG: DUF2993 domain-containing protein [Actinobacteria bacterium]|nr:DUF2993 domain-containing protein [Actinomycetota bacterium]MBU1942708.1 DUF2993 domain-containing protein [Actinomycetota bacterium]MBU2686030.1 DUF2993 domain-containing protein [Actinomycetota bacterium]
MSRGKKRALIIVAAVVVVLLGLWIASEIVIPRVAASYIKKEIRKRYPQAGAIDVSVSAFPAIKLVFKEYDKLHVEVSSITLQDVNFDKITLDSTKWPQGHFKAFIVADEIVRFFSLTHSYVQEATLSMEGDKLRVRGKVNVAGVTVDVDAVGTLEPTAGKLVFFKPAEVNVSGISVPARGVALVNQVMLDNPVFVVREDLPYTITGVKVGGGMLEIEGDANLEKALNIKL